MFEQESKEYRSHNTNYYEWDDFCADDGEPIEEAYQKGAICGYDKANEWHDLRKDPNDLPKENMKQVMVITNYGECLMGWYCIHKKTWYSSDCPDPDDYIETEDIMKIKIIKWKEIVFPKE